MFHSVKYLRLNMLLISFSACLSGRELFLADASLFVDDAEAYEKYQREEKAEAAEEKVILLLFNFIK
jgi:hypothetical protein